jgi:hypothetical protein
LLEQQTLVVAVVEVDSQPGLVAFSSAQILVELADQV